MLRPATARATRRATNVTLPVELLDQARALFQSQSGLCAISGLPFSLTEFADVLVKLKAAAAKAVQTRKG